MVRRHTNLWTQTPIIWFSFIVPAKLTMLLKIISPYKILLFLVCARAKTHNEAVSMRGEWCDGLWLLIKQRPLRKATCDFVSEAGHGDWAYYIRKYNIWQRNIFFLFNCVATLPPKSLGNSLLYRETRKSVTAMTEHLRFPPLWEQWSSGCLCSCALCIGASLPNSCNQKAKFEANFRWLAPKLLLSRFSRVRLCATP